MQKLLAMTPSQPPPAHFTLRQTLTFTPSQQPPSSSSAAYYSPLPLPISLPLPFSPPPSHSHSHFVTDSAAHFHTTVSFPSHQHGLAAVLNSHPAFSHPPISSQPTSHSAAHYSHHILPTPLTHTNSHHPFVLHAPPPFSSPPPPAAPAAPVPPLPPHSHLQSATDPVLFNACLSAVDPSPYPIQPYSFAPSIPVAPAADLTAGGYYFPLRVVRASVWHCPLGCGQSYKKSSGRSIRRHFVSCFRQHNQSAAASMSDSQLSSLIAERQDTGQLQTGLRRWKMRSARRRVDELRDEERWQCVWGCGKRYRSTSTRSISRHIAECDRRQGGGRGGGREHQPRKGKGEAEEEEEDEQEEAEENEEEEERNRQHNHKRDQSTASHSPATNSAAATHRVSSSNDTAASTSSSSASPASSTLPSIFASVSSDPASRPSALHTAGPSTLQLLSSAAIHSLAPHNNTNNIPLSGFDQHASPTSTASSADFQLSPSTSTSGTA